MVQVRTEGFRANSEVPFAQGFKQEAYRFQIARQSGGSCLQQRIGRRRVREMPFFRLLHPDGGANASRERRLIVRDEQTPENVQIRRRCIAVNVFSGMSFSLIGIYSLIFAMTAALFSEGIGFPGGLRSGGGLW